MTRKEVQAKLRALVRVDARLKGWDKKRTDAEIKKALADTDWVLECEKRIKLKRN